MKLGTGLYTGQNVSPDDDGWGTVYNDMQTLVRTTEDAGLDSAWVSEHHFADDGYMPSLLPTLANFASETTDIELGTAVLLAPLHDPVRIAEDAATVSLLSDGRLSLGVANGYRDLEFDAFGVSKRNRGLLTEETIHLARNAWTDGPLAYEPRFHSVSPERDVTPKPEMQPGILLGGVSKAAVRRAAILGDGWIAPERLSLPEIEKRVRYIQRVRAAEKRESDFTIYILQYTFTGPTEEEAWNEIHDSLLHVERKYNEWGSGDPDAELSQDHMRHVRDHGMFGPPSEITEQLSEYEETIEPDVHMILRTYFPGINVDSLRACVEQLGDEVAPAFH